MVRGFVKTPILDMIPIFRRPQSRTLKPSKWILGTAGLQTRPSTNHRRVVITGVGAVTSLGRTFPETWEGVLKGDSGAKVLNETEYDDFPCRVGARVDFDEFEDGTWVGTHGDLKRTPKVVRMALAAAHEALRQANWMPEAGEDRDNTVGLLDAAPRRSMLISLNGRLQTGPRHRILRRQSPRLVRPLHKPPRPILPRLLAHVLASNTHKHPRRRRRNRVWISRADILSEYGLYDWNCCYWRGVSTH